MADISEWSPTDDSNNQAPPNGWPENQSPSSVNNCARAMMGAVRRWYDTVTAQISGLTTALTGYLPLTGGTLTGSLTAPQYGLTGSAYPFALRFEGASWIEGEDGYTGIGLYGPGDNYLTRYYANRHEFLSAAEVVIGGLDASRLSIPTLIDTVQYRIYDVPFAARSGDGAHWIYGGDGQMALALYSDLFYSRATTHIFQNDIGTAQFASLDATGLSVAGNITASGAASIGGGLSAASLTTGDITASGAASIAGALSAGSLTTAGALSAGAVTTGNITASDITAANVTASGTLHVTGDAYTGSLTTATIAASGNVSSSGTVSGPTLLGGTITSTGNITANSGTIQGNIVGATTNVLANGQVFGQTGVRAGSIDGSATFGLWTTGLYSYIGIFTAHWWEYRGETGQLSWMVQGLEFWDMRESDGFCFNQLGAVGGHGAYVNLSDRRFKEDIEPSSVGLAEVLQLEPVQFRRVERLPGLPRPVEVGFIAQDVAPVLPQAVVEAGVELPDGSGGHGSPDPTLGMTSDAIIAALVNSVKTLNERLAALEGVQ